MILFWAGYSIALSALFALGAEQLDRAARVMRLPGRWIWVAAITASLAGPFVVHAFALRAAAVAGAAPAPAAASLVPMFDRLFLLAWAAASLTVGLGLARSAFAHWQEGRTWRHELLDGVAVRVAATAGPAVYGLWRMQIVMPKWLRTIDPNSRSLVLLHELEHARARDPFLLALAAFALLALPWNAALWWQVRRLTLAIEIDCDRRVLNRTPRAREYALMLLSLNQRIAANSMALPIGLVTSQRALESRIRAMTSHHPQRHRRGACVAACGATILVVALACEGPHPDPLSPPSVAAAAPASSVLIVNVLRNGEEVRMLGPSKAGGGDSK